MAQDVLSPPSFSSPDALQQHHLLEKLKQLRLWQEQQQEQLLLQQQEELVNLRSEQATLRTQLGLNKPDDTESISDSPESDSLGTSNFSNVIQSNVSSCTNSLQPLGHTVSGSSLLSNRSADSGMLSGQSSAVDVIRRPSDEGRSSGFHTPSSDDVIVESETEDIEEIVQTSNDVSIMCLS